MRLYVQSSRAEHEALVGDRLSQAEEAGEVTAASESATPDDAVLTGVEQPAAVPSNGRVTSKG